MQHGTPGYMIFMAVMSFGLRLSTISLLSSIFWVIFPKKIKAIKVIKNEDGLPVSVTALLGNDPAVFCLGRNTRDKISGVSIHGGKVPAELYNAYDDHITIRDSRGEEKIPIDTTSPLYLELKEFVEYLHDGPAPRCTLYSAEK